MNFFIKFFFGHDAEASMCSLSVIPQNVEQEVSEMDHKEEDGNHQEAVEDGNHQEAVEDRNQEGVTTNMEGILRKIINRHAILCYDC
jgi:hypothetical protein